MSIDIWTIKMTKNFNKNDISTWCNIDDNFDALLDEKLNKSNRYRDTTLDKYDYKFIKDVTKINSLQEPCCTRYIMKTIADKLNKWKSSWNGEKYLLEIDYSCNKDKIAISADRINDIIEYISVSNELGGVLWISC